MEPGTVLLHGEADETIPIADSRDLVRASGLPEPALIVVGRNHHPADREPPGTMREAVERGLKLIASLTCGE